MESLKYPTCCLYLHLHIQAFIQRVVNNDGRTQPYTSKSNFSIMQDSSTEEVLKINLNKQNNKMKQTIKKNYKEKQVIEL